MKSKVLIFIISFNFLFSQQSRIYNELAETVFKSGIENFNSGLKARKSLIDTVSVKYFSKAFVDFYDVVNLPLNHRTTAGYIMLSKTACYLGRFDTAKAVLDSFIVKFPNSEYITDAYYTRSLVNFKLKNFELAVSDLINAYKKASGIKLEEFKNILKVYLDSLSAVKIDSLITPDLPLDLKYVMVLKASDKIAEGGNIRSARDYLKYWYNSFADTEYGDEISLRIAYYDKLLVKPELKIGAFLPENDNISRSILNGIEIAIDEHNANYKPKVGVEVMYYNSKNIDFKFRGLAKKLDVMAIIGPVYSRDVLLSVRFAEYSGIPVVSPTANANGLTDISSYFF